MAVRCLVGITGQLDFWHNCLGRKECRLTVKALGGLRWLPHNTLPSQRDDPLAKLPKVLDGTAHPRLKPLFEQGQTGLLFQAQDPSELVSGHMPRFSVSRADTRVTSGGCRRSVTPLSIVCPNRGYFTGTSAGWPFLEMMNCIILIGSVALAFFAACTRLSGL